MKKVMLVVVLLLAACVAPEKPQPVPVHDIEVTATPEIIASFSEDEEIRTFSIVWNKGASQFIVTESAVSLLPNDIPRIDLLSEDRENLATFLKKNRAILLNGTEFLEGKLPECRDGSMRITVNGVGKSIPIAGCAIVPEEYNELKFLLRDLERRYYP